MAWQLLHPPTSQEIGLVAQQDHLCFPDTHPLSQAITLLANPKRKRWNKKQTEKNINLKMSSFKLQRFCKGTKMQGSTHMDGKVWWQIKPFRLFVKQNKTTQQASGQVYNRFIWVKTLGMKFQKFGNSSILIMPFAPLQKIRTKNNKSKLSPWKLRWLFWSNL